MDLAAWTAAALNGALAVAVGGLWWRERRLRQAADPATAVTLPAPQPARDSLTGLGTRDEFELALDDAAQRCDRGGPPFSVLYVDLDNLKSVNDAYGHACGDAVIRETARRVGARGACASRIAADEFALLVRGERDAALAAAQALCEALAQPIDHAGGQLLVSCSIGIAGYPHHGARPRLLQKAALALRSVKQAGGAAFAEYTAALGEAHREQAELLHDLRRAVEHGSFELYYQPKIDARSLQVTAAEALVRWKHPRRGFVPPDVFIPLAERHGLMGTLGDWVLREACRQAGAWRREGLRMRVAVNLSPIQMRQDDLVARLESALSANRIPAGRFTCEITETVAMEDTEVTRRAFERLRAAGVHVSIDDFGTGHSSLASLRRLPAAELKIDRAFVCDLETSHDARSIARAIVKMAHSLDLKVVAEGVETEGQRDLLVQMGCDELQGYLFAKPMTASALALWAADERPEAGRSSEFRPSIFAETVPPPLAR